MKSVLCCLLLLGVNLAAQPVSEDEASAAAVRKLRSTLLALKGPGASRLSLSKQLVDGIMSMAESDQQPSRATVARFADELTSALIGKDLRNAHVTILQQSIGEVLRRTGATFMSASRLRETLTAVGVDAWKTHVITKRFIAIGEEVRGPDDIPARPVILKPSPR
jgi:hypothetical protein